MSEVVFNLAKRTSFLVKYIPGGEPYQPLLDYGVTLTENLYKWRKGDKDLTAALVDSIKDQGDKLDEIKAIVSKTSMVVDKTFELTHKSLYLEGIQKVDSAYNTFFNVTSTPEAWEKNVQMFESHYTELTTNYDHFLKPKRVNEYFKLLSETEEVGVQGMVEVATFILATEVKYHQMMVTYHCFVNDFPAVERQYENFKEHLESIHSKVRELGVTQIIPLAQTKGFKLRDSTMLQRMIMLGNIEGLKAVQGYVTPDILNTPTPGSKLQFYTSVVRTKSLQDPLPLVVALHMTTPAAEEIVTLLLELGADLSLPFQDGETIYTYARKNNLIVGTKSLDKIIESIYKGFCANPTPMQFSKLSGLRFTETTGWGRGELINGSLREKLICDIGDRVIKALETIRGKMNVNLNSGTPGCMIDSPGLKAEEPLPLFVAAHMIFTTSGERNYIDIFHLLLQCGADPNLPAAKNESWSTYRFLVCWSNIKEIHHAVDPWVVSLVEKFGGKRDW